MRADDLTVMWKGIPLSELPDYALTRAASEIGVRIRTLEDHPALPELTIVRCLLSEIMAEQLFRVDFRTGATA